MTLDSCSFVTTVESMSYGIQVWNMSNPASYANLTKVALVAMIFEINMVGELEGWWVDTGVSRYVYYDRDMFKTSVVGDMKVLLGNSHTVTVVGNSKVELKFTFGKILLLKNVMHFKSEKEFSVCFVVK